jgi:hypothetical protein
MNNDVCEGNELKTTLVPSKEETSLTCGAELKIKKNR